MYCPDCGFKAFTKQTRHIAGGVVRRRYQCAMCHQRFTTEEQLRTTTERGRDAHGRFVRTNNPAPPKDYSNCCGGCNHWLHDGCALKLRTPSRARRFSASCDDWLKRYGPEAPAPKGRQFKNRVKPARVEQVKPETPQPQPMSLKNPCKNCAFYWGSKCDLGLPKPTKAACGSFLSALEEEAVA